MERDNIIKALECCVTTSAGDCKNCGYRGKSHDNFITCTNCLIADALALITSQDQRIKELTEDNEAKDETITNLLATIADIQADTVRKMQERLKAETITIQDHTGKLGSVVVVGTIDQIAKEMLEVENEN